MVKSKKLLIANQIVQITQLSQKKYLAGIFFIDKYK